jgi:hypothetical protein
VIILQVQRESGDWYDYDAKATKHKIRNSLRRMKREVEEGKLSDRPVRVVNVLSGWEEV